MASDMFSAFLKQAIQKGASDGLFSTLEEMADSLTTPQLEKLIAMMQRVVTKRKTTVEVRQR